MRGTCQDCGPWFAIRLSRFALRRSTAIAVGIPHVRAQAADQKRRRAADRTEGADRRIHSAGNELLSAGLQCAGLVKIAGHGSLFAFRGSLFGVQRKTEEFIRVSAEQVVRKITGKSRWGGNKFATCLSRFALRGQVQLTIRLRPTSNR